MDKKMQRVYNMEYCLAMGKKEILPFVKTWMDFKGIRLGEISQKRSDTV